MARRPASDLTGPSQRMLRVGEVLRRALADVLTRGDLYDADIGTVPITVSEVRLTPDLRHATAFVLPLGGANTDRVLAALERHKGELRRAVTRGIALKYAPELHFLADTSFDRMDETRRLLADPAVRRDVAETGEPEVEPEVEPDGKPDGKLDGGAGA